MLFSTVSNAYKHTAEAGVLKHHRAVSGEQFYTPLGLIWQSNKFETDQAYSSNVIFKIFGYPGLRAANYQTEWGYWLSRSYRQA